MNVEQEAYLLVGAAAGKAAAECVCGCGVLWHFAPSGPCCTSCTGYQWVGLRDHRIVDELVAVNFRLRRENRDLRRQLRALEEARLELIHASEARDSGPLRTQPIGATP